MRKKKVHDSESPFHNIHCIWLSLLFYANGERKALLHELCVSRSRLPLLRMRCNGPRLIQTFRYDHRAICTIQTGDFYQVETVVCPVQVSYVEGRKSRGDLSVLWSAMQRSSTCTCAYELFNARTNQRSSRRRCLPPD